MRTRAITITEISLYTATEEISLKGTVHEGQLSFDTCMFINSTQLNKIINQLQKENEETDVHASFKSECDHDGNLFMWLDTRNYAHASISMEQLANEQKQLLIRA